MVLHQYTIFSHWECSWHCDGRLTAIGLIVYRFTDLKTLTYTINYIREVHLSRCVCELELMGAFKALFTVPIPAKATEGVR